MNARHPTWPSLLAAVLLSGTAMAQTAQPTISDDKAAAQVEAAIGSRPEADGRRGAPAAERRRRGR